MSKYILFRNKGYAEELAGKFVIEPRGIRTIDNIYGINPQDGDIIIIDIHYKGNMAECGGKKIVANLQEKYKQYARKVNFIILSWFSEEEWRSEKWNLKAIRKQLESNEKISFVRLPVTDFDLLKYLSL